MAPSSSKKLPTSSRYGRAETAAMTSLESSGSQVRVFVRVRPITAKELGSGCSNVLEVSDNCVVHLSERQFTYDAAFDATTTQADLYQKLAPSLLKSFLDGFNATVRFIAYHILNFLSVICDVTLTIGFSIILDYGVWSDWIWKDVHHGK